MKSDKRKYREEIKEWRHFFTPKMLQTAQNFVDQGNYRLFSCNEQMASANVGSKGRAFHPVIRNAPLCYSDDWDLDAFQCTCSSANPGRNWWGVEGLKKPCSHEAAVLLLWEKEHGVWRFTETEEEYEERVERERQETEQASLL